MHDVIADQTERQQQLTGALYALAKPTIAALLGPAAGAGLAIALARDIRIAAESVFITTGFVNVGLLGDYGASFFLTQIVATARAREFAAGPTVAYGLMKENLDRALRDDLPSCLGSRWSA